MADQTTTAGLIETNLRVLSWNIWWRYGPWQNRQPAIVETLKNLDCDIIALQEVWQDDTTNYAAILAAELGYHHVFAASMEREGFGFGNALLSRWPISQSQSVMLYGVEENGEGRCALFAEIDGPRGVLPFFATHLNWKFHHSHIRQRQVADLARFVDARATFAFPPVVCGDFNADPMSEEIRMLTGLTTCPVEGLAFQDAWVAARNDSPGFTWDNANPYAVEILEPNRRIDYILAGMPRERGAGHVVSCEVVAKDPVNDVYPSDHYGVVAQLRY